MRHRGQGLLLASLTSMLLGAAGTTELPPISEAPQNSNNTPEKASFGTILQESNRPFNESIRLDPIVEMPPESANLEQLNISYQQKLDSRQYQDAVTIAYRMVEMSDQLHGTSSIESAYALSDLGAALHHDGRDDQAIQPLQQALAIMKDRLGLFHPDLTGSYAYLGMALQGVGEYKESIAEMTRAQHLTHRESGTQNLDQMSMVYAKAHSMEALGEYWETEQLYRAAVKLYRHHYPQGSSEVLTSQYRLAEWLMDFGHYQPALSVYRQALESLQDESGEDTPEMIPAMRGMAVTFLLQPQAAPGSVSGPSSSLNPKLTERPDSTPALRGRAKTFLPHQRAEADRGLRLIRRAAAVTERYPNQFTLYERIRSHLELGDWLLLFQREEQAWEQYAQAWELTRSKPESAIDWQQYFAQPKLIYAGPAISHFYDHGIGNTEQWNEFEFQIEVDGRPSHVNINNSNMHVRTRKRSVEFLRLGRFRPALDNGEPVVTEHFQIRRNYRVGLAADLGVLDPGGDSD